MTSTPKWQVIRTSSVFSPHFLVKLKNLLMPTPGFILLNRSSPFSLYHVQTRVKNLLMPTPGFILLNRSSPFSLYHVRTRVKLTSPPSNFVVLPAFGGITFAPCIPLDMLSLGRNFGLPSGHTIFLKD
jgi:hypothetical protein